MLIQSTPPTFSPAMPRLSQSPPEAEHPILKSRELQQWEARKRERNRLRALRGEGKSMAGITREMEISTTTAYRYLHQLRGTQPTPPRPDTAQDKLLDVLMAANSPLSLQAICRCLKGAPVAYVSRPLSLSEREGVVSFVPDPLSEEGDAFLYFVPGYWAVRTGEDGEDQERRYKCPWDAHAAMVRRLAGTEERVRLEYVDNWRRFDPFFEELEVAKKLRAEQDSAPEALEEGSSLSMGASKEHRGGYRERTTLEVLRMVTRSKERWEERALEEGREKGRPGKHTL